MPVRIKIAGVGTVELGDEFNDLPPEEQERVIEEIAAEHAAAQSDTTQPEEQQQERRGSGRNRGRRNRRAEEANADVKEDAWVGQTVGGAAGATAGAVGGAYVGSLLAPFTFGLSIPIGAIIGGAIGGGLGGAGGEYVEQEIHSGWDGLSPQEQEQIIAAGIEEGVFGAVPGVGAGLGKGARLIQKADRSKTVGWVGDKVKALIKNKAFRSATGKTGSVGVGQIAADSTGKVIDIALDTVAPNKLAAWATKLSNKERKQIINPLIDDFIKNVPADAKIKDELRKDLVGTAYGSEASLTRLFEIAQSTPAGQAAIKKWAKDDIVRKALIGGGLVAGKGGAKAASEIDYYTDEEAAAARGYARGGLVGYAEGGEVDEGGLLSSLRKRAEEAGIDTHWRNGKPKSEKQLRYALRVKESNKRVKEQLSTPASILGGFIPGVGEAMDASDALEAYQKGNYGEALSAAGFGLLGLIPGVGDAAATTARTARRARKAAQAAREGDLGPIDLERGVRTVSDGKGGYRPITQAEMGGWNFSGQPEGEYLEGLDAQYRKMERQKGLTDSERELDDAGLLDDFVEGITSRDDVLIGNKIVEALNRRGANYPVELAIKDILDAADHSKITLTGLTEVISEKTGMPANQVRAMIMSAQ